VDPWPPDAPEYARVLELPPNKQRGWVHEVEVPLDEGESLAYQTKHAVSGGRAAFNVRSHEGPKVTYHVQESGAHLTGTFTAPWRGKFYLMWENLGQPVRVEARAIRSPR